MRLLDIDYRVVKKATEMRADLEDGSKKWKAVTTARHFDRVEWKYIEQWLHSDEASCEDNQRKDMVRVDRGVVDGIITYVLHRARLLLDSRRDLLIKFKASTTHTLMCQDFLSRKVAIRRRRAEVLATQRLRERDEVFFPLSHRIMLA